MILVSKRMKQVTFQIPAHVKNARRAEKLAADEFWAFHQEICNQNGIRGQKQQKRYELLRRRMISARDRRVEAVREFTAAL